MKISSDHVLTRVLSKSGEVLAEYTTGKKTPSALKWWLCEYGEDPQICEDCIISLSFCEQKQCNSQ